MVHEFSEWDRNCLESELADHYRFLTAEEICAAEVVVTQEIPTDFLDGASQLKLVQTPGAGVDKLDLDALSARGIMVSNSHSAAPFVAEHALAMLMDLMKKISVHDRNMKKGQWFRPKSQSESEHLFSDSLIGKSIGFVGFGHVGKAIATLLSGFNVRTLAHTRAWKSRVNENGTAPEFVDLDHLLSNSDAIFITLPSTPETKAIIKRRELDLIKPNAYLINVGRSEVIDEAALLDALKNNKIRGAGLDVWQDGLASAANFAALDHRIIMSPHRAGTDRKASPNLKGVIEALRGYATKGRFDTLIEADVGY